MASTPSPLQLAANQANAKLSTGPRSSPGKSASSRNALSHGLTTRQALLPGEDLEEYQLHRQSYLDHFKPGTPIDRALVIEFADLRWRLLRVPVFEAQILNVEVLKLSTDPSLEPLIEQLDGDEAKILAVAFTRLVESKVLPNLLNQEARLARRAAKIQRHLELSTIEQHFSPAGPVLVDPSPTPEAQIRKIEPNRALHKTGRNQPCPCKSGLKFKRCCLSGGSSAPPTTAHPD